ncbi:MAG: hypothetical protein QM731_13395 [Chitinophagaceae bacterium]
MPTEYNNPGKIESILDGLDGMQRAKAPAFFYTRLKARMDRELESSGGPLVRLLTRPALALSLAAIILIINATAILQMWNSESAAPNVATESTQLVASDYPISTYPVYDENPVEP